MRLICSILLLAVLPKPAHAGTVLYQDPFGKTASSCPSSSCDVIGEQAWFDLGTLLISIDPYTLRGTITTTLNFGPGTTLDPFYDFGIKLSAADVIFTVDGAARFGVALTSHSGVSAGTLYQVNTPGGVLTAGDVLHLSSDYVYRPEARVWLNDDGYNSVTALNTGTVDVAVTGDGWNAPHLTVTIAFLATPEFFAWVSSGSFTVEFASATCGNDILIGQLPISNDQVPEPATWMGGFAAGVLILLKARRTRRR